MTDQPTNRELYAAILDLRGRIEAVAWDLTAIEDRLDRLAGREERCGAHDTAVERRLSAVAETLTATAERSARVETGVAEIRDGLATATSTMPDMGQSITRVEQDIRTLCRLLDGRLAQ